MFSLCQDWITSIPSFPAALGLIFPFSNCESLQQLSPLINKFQSTGVDNMTITFGIYSSMAVRLTAGRRAREGAWFGWGLLFPDAKLWLVTPLIKHTPLVGPFHHKSQTSTLLITRSDHHSQGVGGGGGSYLLSSHSTTKYPKQMFQQYISSTNFP